MNTQIIKILKLITPEICYEYLESEDWVKIEEINPDYISFEKKGKKQKFILFYKDNCNKRYYEKLFKFLKNLSEIEASSVQEIFSNILFIANNFYKKEVEEYKTEIDIILNELEYKTEISIILKELEDKALQQKIRSKKLFNHNKLTLHIQLLENNIELIEYYYNLSSDTKDSLLEDLEDYFRFKNTRLKPGKVVQVINENTIVTNIGLDNSNIEKGQKYEVIKLGQIFSNELEISCEYDIHCGTFTVIHIQSDISIMYCEKIVSDIFVGNIVFRNWD